MIHDRDTGLIEQRRGGECGLKVARGGERSGERSFDIEHDFRIDVRRSID